MASLYTSLLKPDKFIVTDKHYWSQISDIGINTSIRIDKHNSTSLHTTLINS